MSSWPDRDGRSVLATQPELRPPGNRRHGKAGKAAGKKLLPAAALGLTCLAALAALDWFAVHTVRGRILDGRSLRGAQLTDSGATRAVEQVLDVVSVSSILAAVGVVVGVALVRRRWTLGMAAMVLLAGANITTQLLKHIVLSRPSLGPTEPAAATANSLPSGHVTVVFSVAVALVLVLPAALRVPAATAGVLLTLTTGIATMTAGWHRASDAIAACLVVGLWAAAVLPAAQNRGSAPPGPTAGGQTRSLITAAAVLLTGGALLAGALLVAAPTSPHTAVLLAAYAAGGLLTGGTAAPVMTVVLRLRRHPTSASPRPVDGPSATW